MHTLQQRASWLPDMLTLWPLQVPGGKVVVHSGLLDIMRTDDELAAVLAHEIAHVIARHRVRANPKP